MDSEAVRPASLRPYFAVRRVGTRYVWPFKQMDIGDQVRIEPVLSVRARDAAASYGLSSGKRFRVHLNPVDKSLLVTRGKDR